MGFTVAEGPGHRRPTEYNFTALNIPPGSPGPSGRTTPSTSMPRRKTARGCCSAPTRAPVQIRTMQSRKRRPSGSSCRAAPTAAIHDARPTRPCSIRSKDWLWMRTTHMGHLKWAAWMEFCRVLSSSIDDRAGPLPRPATSPSPNPRHGGGYRLHPRRSATSSENRRRRRLAGNSRLRHGAIRTVLEQLRGSRSRSKYQGFAFGIGRRAVGNAQVRHSRSSGRSIDSDDLRWLRAFRLRARWMCRRSLGRLSSDEILPEMARAGASRNGRHARRKSPTKLTMIGLELDEPRTTRPRQAQADFVVGQVLEDAKPHPDADRLQVCTGRDNGAETRCEVVCGAPNARTGMNGVFRAGRQLYARASTYGAEEDEDSRRRPPTACCCSEREIEPFGRA